ncbi:MAG: hypothetical protein WD733_24595 [Bryobacterales bacterium]
MVLSKHIGRILAIGALALAPGMMSAQSENKPPSTGPAVGKKIPAFEVVDQAGRRQTFETLRGPNGLLLLFYRSADW